MTEYHVRSRPGGTTVRVSRPGGVTRVRTRLAGGSAGGAGLTGDSEIVADSTTLTGPPHTIAVAAAGSIDITVTLPDATVDDKGLVWYIRNLNSDSVVYVANLAEGDETITESKGLLVSGIETDTPGTYAWMKVGFVSETGTSGGGGGGVTDHGLLTGLSDDDHTQYAKKASNLSDLASAATARTNLGLGTAAVAATGDFDAAGTAAGLVDDLSGVSNQATARTNLGLGTAATAATGDFAATSHTHTGTQVTVDASGFNGNLTTSDDTVQEIAQKLDDLVIPAAGIADPGGANDDFVQRKSGAWTNRTVAQVKADLGVGGPAGFYEDNVYHGLLGHIHSQFSGGGPALVVGANLLVLWRIMPVETVDVDGFTLMVQVDGGSGGLARVGIFPASTSTTEPTGTPVVESGNLNVNVGAGTILTDTFTSGRLSAYTPYWGAFVTNSASLSVRFLAGAQNTQSAVMESGIVNSASHIGRRVAHTFGALPSNPAAPFNNNVALLPGVLWRTQRI